MNYKFKMRQRVTALCMAAMMCCGMLPYGALAEDSARPVVVATPEQAATQEAKSETEEALSKTSELMAATVDYAKTRPVFDGYKAARYSKKYLAQHEAELATYRAAKDTMNTILNGAKLPKIEALKKSRRELAGQKKALYAEYREAQRQMREAVAIKANIDHLLGITDERENKAQER